MWPLTGSTSRRTASRYENRPPRHPSPSSGPAVAPVRWQTEQAGRNLSSLSISGVRPHSLLCVAKVHVGPHVVQYWVPRVL